MLRRTTVAGLLLLPGLVSTISDIRAAEVELLNTRTPWRVFFVPSTNSSAKRDSGPIASLLAPPEGWTKPNFDDSAWARYLDDLPDLLNWESKGRRKSISTKLYLRTNFGIADPRRARDLRVTVDGSTGGTVFLNGRELGNGSRVDIPPEVLVKGRNVLAVELERSAGFLSIRLTSSSGAGVIAYDEAIKGTHAWGAMTVQPVANSVPEKAPVNRNWFHSLLWSRGMPLKGVQIGNPFDRLRPIRMVAPRGGVCSGQAVLSDLDGLRDVGAAIAEFRGPAGQRIPAGNVQIRYAVQRPGIDYCDALMEQPPDGANTVPVWLVTQIAKDQRPGWYTSTLTLRANGKSFNVPVQLLVCGFAIASASDLDCPISVTQSPETLALHYQVEPWSDDHWQLLEKSFELMGQVNNQVVYVPVILGTARVGRGLTPARVNRDDWRFPLIRWVKTDRGLQPEFSLLEKYLDLYLKHCTPPRALCLYIWDSAYAKQVADFYENRRVPTRAMEAQADPMVLQWDPATGETNEIPAPRFEDAGADRFWRPVFDGVRSIVRRRGWSERTILLGLGGDLRPSTATADRLRQWAPYARWNLLSHFSGDPAPVDGRLTAGGNLEVGFKQWPWMICGRALPARGWEQQVEQQLDFLAMPTARWHHQEFSPPIMFRTLPLLWGSVSHLGLDFWMPGADGGPSNTSFFVHVNALTAPGPDGAIPTVRFQMLREAVQDVHVRRAMIRAYLNLPEEQRQRYRDLLDEFTLRVAFGAHIPSGGELSYDWPDYVARVYQTAGDLTGQKTGASLDNPPK